MSRFLVALAAAGAMSAPAFAQVQPQAAQPASQAAPAAKPATVKKTVCHRVDDEESTGSRLGSAPQVCKTIEVPAPAAGATGQQTPAPEPR
jgi:hypothetical protein